MTKILNEVAENIVLRHLDCPAGISVNEQTPFLTVGFSTATWQPNRPANDNAIAPTALDAITPTDSAGV
jgi:hypothetical protein